MAYSNLLGQIRIGVRPSLVVPTLSLLDTYSAAELALSLRRLKSTYSGFGIKVRRSSDNLEQDINFNSNGDLNETTLLNFVGVKNYLNYTEEFDNAWWVKLNVSVTSNATTAPNGTMTADLLSETTGTGTHTIYKSNSYALYAYPEMVAGFSWNFSIYIKKGPGTNAPNKIALSNSYGGVASDTILVTYDMGTGNSQLIQTGGFLNTGCTMSNVGDGWWRCFMWGTSNGQYWQRPDVVKFIDNGNRIVDAYVGNTQSNIYIWGMQLTQGTASRTYAKSSATVSGDGYITKWYDQSGNNRHADQPTSSMQPQIVSGGSVMKVNGKPAAYFNGSARITPAYTTSKLINSNFLTSTTDNQYVYPWSTSTFHGFVAHSGNGGSAYNSYGSAVLYTNFNLRNYGNRDIIYNALLGTKIITHQNSSVNGWTALNFGSYLDSNFSYIGYLQEWTIYPATYSVVDIHSNMNSYFQVVGSVTDSDAQLFIGAAGLTSSTQASAINTLVTSLKTAGIWTKMKAIYPFVGGTADSHKFNLKDPRDSNAAFRLTFSGGWTHTATGALPNGTNAWANTYFSEYSNITNSDTQLSNFTHASLYSRTNSPSINQYGGIGTDNSQDGYGLLQINTKRADGLSYGYSRGTIAATPTNIPDSRGLFLINRQSNSLLKYTRNNSLISQNTTLNTSGASRISFYLGGINNWGSAAYFDNKEHSFVTLGYSLTDAESAAFYTAVQAFQTSLGRQV